MRSHHVQRVLVGILVAAAYVGAAKLGIELSVAHGVITPVWAPPGSRSPRSSSSAAALAGGRARRLIANATSGASICSTQRASRSATRSRRSSAASLLRRVGFRPALDRVRDVFALDRPRARSLQHDDRATNGVTTLWLSGDVAGARLRLGVAALVDRRRDGRPDRGAAHLRALRRRPWRSSDRRARLEGLVRPRRRSSRLSAIVFLGGCWRYPHLLFPLLSGRRSASGSSARSTSSFVVAAIAVAGADRGHDADRRRRARPRSSRSSRALTAGVAISLLILGAVLAERSRARAAARSAPTRASPRPRRSRTSAAGSGTSPPTGSPGRTSSTASRASSRSRSQLTYERVSSTASIPTIASGSRAIVEHALARVRGPFDFEHRVVLPDGARPLAARVGPGHRRRGRDAGAHGRHRAGRHRAQAGRRAARHDPLGRLARAAHAADVDHRLLDDAEGAGRDPRPSVRGRDGRALGDQSAQARPPALRPARPRPAPPRLRAAERSRRPTSASSSTTSSPRCVRRHVGRSH